MLRIRAFCPLLVGVLLLATAGCPGRAPEAKRASSEGRSAQRRASQSSVLLKAIASQLRSLPEAAQLELNPPTVLLDSRRSADGEDIEAVLSRAPGAPPGAPANVLTVPRGNARFRSARVEPGDTIKYFVIPDRDTMDRLRESGDVDIVTFTAANLTVAQVLDDSSLLVVGGLAQEVAFPAKIEVWRTVDTRMQEIDRKLGRYTERRDPPLAWLPSPDESALAQMGERLNQWLRQKTRQAQQGESAEPAERKAAITDPATAISTLPVEMFEDDDRGEGDTKHEGKELAQYLSDEQLASNAFSAADCRLIQQAVWLRDIGTWSRGDATDVAGQARRLFDWVVRCVQLAPDDERAPRYPWEVALVGQGTADQRAWVFVELCRQQGIAAFVLLAPSESAGDRTLVGVLDGDDVLVFDPELGAPLRAADGEAIATLESLRGDDSLLRSLDLADTPYPHSSDDLTAVQPAIVADRFSMSDRAAALAKALTGADSLALSADIADYADLVQSRFEDAEVILWDLPIRTLREKLNAPQRTRRRAVRSLLPYAWRPRLWKARTLHFRGRLAEANQRRDALADDVDDHYDAQRLYMSPRVRPTSRALDNVGSEVKREIYRAAKNSATLWCGVLAYDRGNYETAIDWLERALEDPALADRHDAARYNLARACEAAGDLERATDLLEADDSPQRHGNRLLAERLRRRLEDQASGGE